MSDETGLDKLEAAVTSLKASQDGVDALESGNGHARFGYVAGTTCFLAALFHDAAGAEQAKAALESLRGPVSDGAYLFIEKAVKVMSVSFAVLSFYEVYRRTIDTDVVLDPMKKSIAENADVMRDLLEKSRPLAVSDEEREKVQQALDELDAAEALLAKNIDDQSLSVGNIMTISAGLVASAMGLTELAAQAAGLLSQGGIPADMIPGTLTIHAGFTLLAAYGLTRNNLRAVEAERPVLEDVGQFVGRIDEMVRDAESFIAFQKANAGGLQEEQEAGLRAGAVLGAHVAAPHRQL